MQYRESLKRIDELKKELDQFRPLDDCQASQLREYFRIGFTYSSNALEGNTLTESETKVVIEDGLTIGGKPLRDHNEALGHSEAFDYLFELTRCAVIGEKEIKNLHRLFFYRIDPANAGKYRRTPVVITGTTFIPPRPSEIPDKMQEFVDMMPGAMDQLHPVLFAAMLHRELVSIHPFVDGNGRTARLLMNLALLRAGYGIAIIPPVLRSEYILALRKAQEDGDSEPFDGLMVDMVYETMKDMLRVLTALGDA